MLFQKLTGRANFEADDQSALVYLLITQKEEWTGKEFLENSYYLHGYLEVIIPLTHVSDKWREISTQEARQTHRFLHRKLGSPKVR